MNMKFVSARVVAGVMLAAAGSIVHAYDAVEVTNGGTISGKITFSGSPPANPSHSITKDEDFCGASIAADYILVGGDGGLKNAVVAIENIDKGKAYDMKGIVEFENTKCMFEPHVSTAVAGQKLGIVSRDPILHNTHLYHGPKERTLYNIAIPLQDKVIKKPLRKPGKVTVKCDAHEWMLGYVYVTTNPYASVSAADGSFTISEVPPGTYKIKVWHEKLGEVTQDVTVSAGGTATVNHAFSQ
jgi:plastocyanin